MFRHDVFDVVDTDARGLRNAAVSVRSSSSQCAETSFGRRRGGCVRRSDDLEDAGLGTCFDTASFIRTFVEELYCLDPVHGGFFVPRAC